MNKLLITFLTAVIVVITFIFILAVKDLEETKDEVEELRILVEYHQNQTFELIGEIQKMKKGEGE